MTRWSLDPGIAASFPFSADSGAQVVVAAYMGSISHGTADPDPSSIDDVDIMGAILPPTSCLLGLDQFDHWDSFIGRYDLTFYDLHKLVRLWLKGNPNVIGLLWLRDEDYLLRTPAFDAFREIRSGLLSKQLYEPFRGYGRSQLRDIEKKVYQGYMGPKRRALVDQFGYDTKHAAHSIRLVRMAEEVLRTGILRVYRGGHDADELRAIKAGAWPRERVLTEAEHWFRKLDEAYAASTLPEEPNRVLVSQTLVRVTEDHLERAKALRGRQDLSVIWEELQQ